MIGPIAGVLFAACLAFASRRLRWLTIDGAMAQFVLGALLFGLGGWPWAIPIIVFFLSSSVLSVSFRARRGSSEEHYAKASERDLLQVLANGGVGGVLVLIMSLADLPAAYVAYVASCAAAGADTWATEIGTLFPRMPRMIVGFSRVERGRSGAVSLRGMLAAAAGSLVVASSAHPWVVSENRWSTMAIVTSTGFAGSLIDSILGATLQGQWLCRKCGRTVEKAIHCGENADLASGFEFMTNDLVNLISIAAAAALAWWGYSSFLARS